MNHTLLIAIAMVCGIAAVAAILILITKRQARARKKALWEAFRTLQFQHNIEPDQVEELPHRIFGVDTLRKVFIFAQQDDARPTEVVQLDDVADCRLIKSGFTIDTGRGGKNHFTEQIKSIALQFILKNGGKTDIPIYAEMLDGMEAREDLRQTAERWQQRVESLLKAPRPKLTQNSPV